MQVTWIPARARRRVVRRPTGPAPITVTIIGDMVGSPLATSAWRMVPIEGTLQLLGFVIALSV